MRGALLDTGALYSSARREESRHRECRLELVRLMAAHVPLVTTELVLAELHALALTRIGADPAMAVLGTVVSSPRVEVMAVDRDLRARAIDLLRSRPGRAYTLADAVSFVVMRERGIASAFTLDADFAAEGFTVLPAV